MDFPFSHERLEDGEQKGDISEPFQQYRRHAPQYPRNRYQARRDPKQPSERNGQGYTEAKAGADPEPGSVHGPGEGNPERRRRHKSMQCGLGVNF